MLVDSVYICINLQRRLKVATRKLTDKQKDKLKNSKYVRSNSDDVTVNPNFEDDIEYDEDEGTLSYDKRTKEGKEIERILNSRNRKSSSPVDEEPEEDDEEVWDDDEDDDEDFNSNEENNETELPEVRSCYRGWDIRVEKDDAHKFKISAVLEKDDEYEIDRITIYGDEIDEDTDVDTFVTDRIDEREDERAKARDWKKNYAGYMGLDEDPDWEESYDFD